MADIGGTEFDEDLAAVEERAAPGGVGAPGDDEGEFEPFNLDEERETGHFDDDGNYVFRKEEVRRRVAVAASDVGCGKLTPWDGVARNTRRTRGWKASRWTKRWRQKPDRRRRRRRPSRRYVERGEATSHCVSRTLTLDLQHLPDEELGRMQMEIADMLHPVRLGSLPPAPSSFRGSHIFVCHPGRTSPC